MPLLLRLSHHVIVCLLLAFSTMLPAQQPEGRESDGRIQAPTFTSKETQQTYEKALKGDRQSQFLIGRAYHQGDGIYQSLSEAATWYLAAAKQGHGQAQYYLAELYDKGKGIDQNSIEAFKWFRQAADNGIAEAQFAVGMAYSSGNGVEQNPPESIKWLTKAAQNGSANAQYVLALIYRDAIDTPQKPIESFNYALMAARQDQSSAQNLLGQYYEQGFGTQRNVEEAKKWYLASAKHEDADAQLNMGALLLSESNTQDKEAIDWIQKAVAQGHPDAQFLLALCYQQGIGVRQDMNQAIKFMSQAADQGIFAAKMTMASYYYAQADTQKRERIKALLDEGIAYLTEDPAIAKDLLSVRSAKLRSMALSYLDGLKKLASAGVIDANIILAMLYQQGQVVDKNDAQARQFYRQAAVDGNVEAQYRYAMMLSNEQQDNPEAAKWFLTAANQGYPQAQWAISQAYHLGTGVQQDPNLAFTWALNAAEKGVDKAQAAVAAYYRDGLGTSKNIEESYRWFMKSFDTSDDPAMLYAAAKLYIDEMQLHKITNSIQLLQNAADKGYAPAKLQLGLIYRDAIGVSQHSEKALGWLTAAEKDGLIAASVELGNWYSRLTPPDWAQALPYYRKAAEAQNIDAQYVIGRAFLDKKTTLVTESEALGWLLTAAENNHVGALIALGAWHADQQNIREAAVFYERAAQLGSADAQFTLGRLYAEGEFIGMNSGRDAEHWLLLSANQGHLAAMKLLGDLYLQDKMLPRNLKEAVYWYEKAATAGFPDAQFQMGHFYQTGVGLQKNDKEAIRWYRLAANQGHDGAKEILKKMRIKP